MRRKVGTTLDAILYQRAKEAARQQGRSLTEVIEQALDLYLSSTTPRALIAAQTKGTFKVSEKALRAVLGENLYVGARSQPEREVNLRALAVRLPRMTPLLPATARPTQRRRRDSSNSHPPRNPCGSRTL